MILSFLAIAFCIHGRFAFGLGKRNLKENDFDQWLNDEEYLPVDDTEDEIEDEEEDSQEVMDKRSQITTGVNNKGGHTRY